MNNSDELGYNTILLGKSLRHMTSFILLKYIRDILDILIHSIGSNLSYFMCKINFLLVLEAQGLIYYIYLCFSSL